MQVIGDPGGIQDATESVAHPHTHVRVVQAREDKVPVAQEREKMDTWTDVHKMVSLQVSQRHAKLLC